MSEGTETLREPEGTESGTGVGDGEVEETVGGAEGGGLSRYLQCPHQGGRPQELPPILPPTLM